jgi:hypothetical protein
VDSEASSRNKPRALTEGHIVSELNLEDSLMALPDIPMKPRFLTVGRGSFIASKQDNLSLHAKGANDESLMIVYRFIPGLESQRFLRHTGPDPLWSLNPRQRRIASPDVHHADWFRGLDRNPDLCSE